jgi:hypothetical protein
MEQAGGAEPGRNIEHFGVPIDAPEVQAALALAAYRVVHHREDVNPADWQENDEEVRTEAMFEWTGGPNDASPAAQYRAYADAHPHERIDMNDREALEELLAALTSREQ